MPGKPDQRIRLRRTAPDAVCVARRTCAPQRPAISTATTPVRKIPSKVPPPPIEATGAPDLRRAGAGVAHEVTPPYLRRTFGLIKLLSHDRALRKRSHVGFEVNQLRSSRRGRRAVQRTDYTTPDLLR